jgi:hypothetical protein
MQRIVSLLSFCKIARGFFFSNQAHQRGWWHSADFPAFVRPGTDSSRFSVMADDGPRVGKKSRHHTMVLSRNRF